VCYSRGMGGGGVPQLECAADGGQDAAPAKLTPPLERLPCCPRRGRARQGATGKPREAEVGGKLRASAGASLSRAKASSLPASLPPHRASGPAPFLRPFPLHRPPEPRPIPCLSLDTWERLQVTAVSWATAGFGSFRTPRSRKEGLALPTSSPDLVQAGGDLFREGGPSGKGALQGSNPVPGKVWWEGQGSGLLTSWPRPRMSGGKVWWDCALTGPRHHSALWWSSMMAQHHTEASVQFCTNSVHMYVLVPYCTSKLPWNG